MSLPPQSALLPRQQACWCRGILSNRPNSTGRGGGHVVGHCDLYAALRHRRQPGISLAHHRRAHPRPDPVFISSPPSTDGDRIASSRPALSPSSVPWGGLGTVRKGMQPPGESSLSINSLHPAPTNTLPAGGIVYELLAVSTGGPAPDPCRRRCRPYCLLRRR